MKPAGIFEKLQTEGVEGVVEFSEGPADPSILVETAKLPDVVEFLKENEELRMNQLSLISGVHYKDRFECVYHLLSTIFRHDVVLRVKLDAADPAVPTLSGVHPTAEWHERETFDLVGIRFEGHPDPRRIYLPETWVGHPLRRDYVDPESFEGIPLTDEKRKEWKAAPPPEEGQKDAAENAGDAAGTEDEKN